jgi:peptide/nickel transport system substrate-binding protein
MRNGVALLPVLLVLGACERSGEGRGGAGGDVGGTLVIAAVAEPATLMPITMSGTNDRAVVDQLFDPLAHLGTELNTIGDRGFTPGLAKSWTWADDSLSIAFSLDPAARWHDGTPVRASDVKFAFDLTKNPATRAHSTSNIARIDSVTVRDSLTAVYWFHVRYPEQFYDAVYHVLPIPRHLLAGEDPSQLRSSAFSRKPVGNGPYRLQRWEPRQVVELVADTTYRKGRPKLDRILFLVSGDLPTAVNRVLSGEADFAENVVPSALPQIDAAKDYRLEEYPSLNLSFMIFNERMRNNRERPHPLFADRNLRRALVMGIDQEATVKNAIDSLGRVGRGPFTSRGWAAAADLPRVPYDTAAAARLLDSLGWKDTNGDSVRDRRGVPLRFSALVQSTSVTRRRYAALMQSQLRNLGVQVDVEELEPAAFGPRWFGRDFDAVLFSLTLDPSPSTFRQSWSSEAARQPASLNFAGYANPAVDALADSAVREFDPVKAKALYRRLYERLNADVPAVWLYELRNFALVHRRFRTSNLRADAWWAGLRDWSIPEGQRIDRDKVGLRAPAG